MLAQVFGDSAEFWLNAQRCNDLWDALHSSQRRAPANFVGRFPGFQIPRTPGEKSGLTYPNTEHLRRVRADF